MHTVSIDMYQTMAIAVVVLIFGGWIKKKIRFLDRFCVPAPVVGGLVYAVIMFVLHTYNVVDFQYEAFAVCHIEIVVHPLQTASLQLRRVAGHHAGAERRNPHHLLKRSGFLPFV